MKLFTLFTVTFPMQVFASESISQANNSVLLCLLFVNIFIIWFFISNFNSIKKDFINNMNLKKILMLYNNNISLISNINNLKNQYETLKIKNSDLEQKKHLYLCELDQLKKDTQTIQSKIDLQNKIIQENKELNKSIQLPKNQMILVNYSPNANLHKFIISKSKEKEI